MRKESTVKAERGEKGKTLRGSHTRTPSLRHPKTLCQHRRRLLPVTAICRARYYLRIRPQAPLPFQSISCSQNEHHTLPKALLRTVHRHPQTTMHLSKAFAEPKFCPAAPRNQSIGPRFPRTAPVLEEPSKSREGLTDIHFERRIQ